MTSEGGNQEYEGRQKGRLGLSENKLAKRKTQQRAEGHWKVNIKSKKVGRKTELVYLGIK